MGEKIKKIFVALAVVGLLLSPVGAFAQSSSGNTNVVVDLNDPLGTARSLADIVVNGKADALATVSGWIKEGAKFTDVSFDFLVGSAALLTLSARVDPFGDFLSASAQGAFGIGTAIQNAHKFILNLANLGFIFLLLWIALATIFGIEQYGASKLLPRLAVVILLSNFALFGVVAISNFSQLLTQGVTGGFWNFIQPIFEVIKTQGLTEALSGAALNLASDLQGTGFVMALFKPLFWMGLVVFGTAIFLFVRIIALWILAIFAPFGIILFALPATQGAAKNYWKKVISFAFAGPLMVFFVRLAVILWSSVMTGSKTGILGVALDVLGNVSKTAKFLGFAHSSLSSLIAVLVFVITVIIGWVFVRKMMKDGMDLAEKWGKKLWGGITGFAKTAAAAGIAVGGVLLAPETLGLSLGLEGAAGGLLANTLGRAVATEAGRSRVRKVLKAGEAGIKKIGKKDGFIHKLGGSLGNAAQRLEARPTVSRENPAESPEVSNSENAGAIRARDGFSVDENVQDQMAAIRETVGEGDKATKIRELIQEVGDKAAMTGSDDVEQEDTRAGMAALMAENGLLDSASALRAASGSVVTSAHQQLIAAEAARRANMLLASNVGTIDSSGNLTVQDNDALKNLVANNSVDFQSPKALGDYRLAGAIHETGKDTERQRNAWTDEQNLAYASGLQEWLHRAGTAASANQNGVRQMSNQQYESTATAAVRAGGDINEVLGAQGGQKAINVSLKQRLAADVRSYDRQSNQGLISLAVNLTPEQLSKLAPQLKRAQQNVLKEAAKKGELGDGRDEVILSNPLFNIQKQKK